MTRSSTASRQPRQDRSRRTLDRLFDAARRLVEDRGFSELRIADLLAAAECSPSSFYARFGDMDTFVASFVDDLLAGAVRRHRVGLERGQWANASVEEIARWYITRHVEAAQRHRRILRALVLHLASVEHGRLQRRRELINARAIEDFADLLVERAPTLAQPDARLAIRLGMLMVLYTVREVIVLGDPTPTHLGVHLARPARLANELTRSFLAYIGDGRGSAETPRTHYRVESTNARSGTGQAGRHRGIRRMG